MKKDEILDLVIKGFGVYLFVLAVTALAAAAEAATRLVYLSSLSMPGANPDYAQAMSAGFRMMNRTAIPEALVKAGIYFVVAYNLLTSSSWIKAIVKRGQIAEPPAGGDGKPAPQP